MNDVTASLKRGGAQGAWVAGLFYGGAYAPLAVAVALPVWMRHAGLTEYQIGIVGSAGIALRLLATPAVATIADRSGKRKRLLAIVVIGAAGCSLLYYLAGRLHSVDAFIWILIVYALTNLFSSNILPLGDSVLLPYLKERRLDYGSVRRWGSICFVCVSVTLGLAVEKLGAAVTIAFLVTCYAALSIVVAYLPGDGNAASAAQARAPWPLLRQRSLLLLLGSAAVVQASHATFYFYGSLYWLSHGLSPASIGALWALGVLCEIAVFSASHRFAERITAASLIALGSACAVARWGLLAWDGGIGVGLIVQLLQGGTLALTQVGVARYATSTFPREAMSTVTGIYYTFAYGIFSAAFVYAGGAAYLRAAALPFAVAAACCACAFICSRRLMRQAPGAGSDSPNG
jgi:MFS transporter, PPP family, 3-phenylpropionic acid transporter